MKIAQAAEIRIGYCRHCRLAIKRGEWFVSSHMPNNPITDRYFLIHVKCMKDLIANVPDDDVAALINFVLLRDKIASTGRAFPD